MTFRKSIRLFLIRLILIQIITVIVVSLLTSINIITVMVLALISGGLVTLWYIITNYLPEKIIVDNNHIEAVRGKESIVIRWVDVKDVVIGQTIVKLKKGILPINYAIVYGLGTKKIAFSDLSYLEGKKITVSIPEPVQLFDIANSELLLAIVMDRTGKLEKLKEIRKKFESEKESPEEEKREKNDERSTGGKLGIWVVIIKVGSKIFKGIISAFKTVKPGFALISGATFAILWSWQVAIALMIMLFFHEYGHVYAMKRSGLKVKGIYFIPLLGAAAVTEDSWKTRKQQAYIGLNGPIWGTFLTLISTSLFVITDYKYQWLGAISLWWALINIFNLLPINPLDGGRVLSAIAYSINSLLGKFLSITMIIVAMLITLLLKLYLFVIVGIVGLIEFSMELQTTKFISILNSLKNKDLLSPEIMLIFRKATRPIWRRSSESKIMSIELSRYRRYFKIGKIVPMNKLEIIKWSSLYIIVTTILLGIMYFCSHHLKTTALLEVLK